MNRPIIPAVLLMSFAAAFLVAAGPVARGGTDGVSILPSDPRIRYEGRLDATEAARPVLVWQGSRVSLDFDGGELGLRFEPRTDQVFFDVTVDGVTRVVGVPVKAPTGAVPDGVAILGPRDGDPVRQWRWPLSLGPGRHHLEIFKRTEASAGDAVFAGIELAPGAQAFAPPPATYRFRLQFIGDSITAGACNEDGPEDQWEDRRTHNFAFSYANLTAQALGADLRCTAVSGMGLTPAWFPTPVAQIWDRVYPRADSPRADLATWVPDVVCINLGENDDSFNRAHHQPFPAAYTPAYVELVRRVRAAWPAARIVLLRGGMFGGAKSDELRAAWEAVVREAEAADPGVSHFVFTHWSQNHPRVRDDRAMADELVAWFGRQAFLPKAR